MGYSPRNPSEPDLQRKGCFVEKGQGERLLPGFPIQGTSPRSFLGKGDGSERAFYGAGQVFPEGSHSRGADSQRARKGLNVGLDASTLIASVKRDGEKFHGDALELARRIKDQGHRGVSSSLALIEVPGALSSSTRMPIEKVYDVLVSVLAGFSVDIMPFEGQVDRAVEFMLEFRELKRKADVGSADFHYLAAAYNEGCGLFVTTDEKHLLRPEVRNSLSKYLEVVTPSEALKKI